MKKRILSTALASIMLAGCFAFGACGEKTPPTVTDPVVTTAAADITTEVPDTTEPPIVCPIEEQDLEGYDFLALEASFKLVASYSDFICTEEGGTILDNAIFNRNEAVCDRLNMTIESKHVIVGSAGSSESYGVLIRDKTSGDCNYDIAILPAYDQSQISYAGANYNMNLIDSIDFSNEWWDQMAVESLEIKGMQFFTTGDFSIDNFNSTIIIAFNKSIAKEKNIPDLYKTVNEGKWTLDTWKQYSSLVSEDLNGDEMFTDADLYGSLVWDDSIYAVVNAAGENCCVVGDDGNMVLTLGTEGVISIFKDYTDFVIQNDCVLRYQHTFNADGTKKFNATSPLEHTLFANNQGLFLFTWLGVTSHFRDMETDYGILPVFKYTEAQDDYYCTVAPYNSRFLSLPYHQEDAERTGVILETIGYYSQQFVRPAFYDKMLYGTIVRDEESREMLDLIYDNRVFDLGYYYQPADINKNLLYLFRADNSNWASRYKALEKPANTKLKQMNKLFDDLAKEEK